MKSRIALFALLLAPALLRAGNNVWTGHGPGGGSVSALAIDSKNPDTLYVIAGAGRLFKSTDGGANWNDAGSGLPGSVFGLAIDPQNPRILYAWAGTLFKSTDGAQSWSELLPQANISLLLFDPQNSSTLYGASSSGVIKSTDGGAHWTGANSGLEGMGVYALALSSEDPTVLYAGAFNRSGGNAGGLLRSTDAGATWIAPLQQKFLDLGLESASCDTWNYYYARITGRSAPPADQLSCYPPDNREMEITAEQYLTAVQNFALRSPKAADFGLIANVRTLLVDPRNSNKVYALTGRGIFVSVDGALTWNDASPGQQLQFSLSFISIDRADPATVYAGLSFGSRLYKTVDGGFSWDSVQLPGNGAINVLAVDPRDPGTIFAGTSFGLFKTTDAARNWISRDLGMADANVFMLTVDRRNAGTVYAGVGGGSPGIYKTTDAGSTWLKTDFVTTLGGFAGVLAIDPQNSATLYAVGSCCPPQRPALFKSTDAGATWFPTGLQELPGSLLIDPRNSNTLYARSGLVGGGIIKSTDGGATWHPVNSGLGTPNNVPNLSLVMDQQNPDNLYAIRYSDGQLFRTTDGAATWTAGNNGWDGRLFHVSALAPDPQNSGTFYAGTSGFDCGYGDTCPPDYYSQAEAAGGAGIFKTTDGGQTWVRLDVPQPAAGYFGFYILAVDPKDPNAIYTVADYPSRVLRSTDGGATWKALSAGLTANQITGLAVDGQSPSTVYAGTAGSGVIAITFGAQ